MWGDYRQYEIQKFAVARTQSGFDTGASWPCNINTARNSAAKLDKLSRIKSQSFSIETEAGI
jgi:hypothetical protein